MTKLSILAEDVPQTIPGHTLVGSEDGESFENRQMIETDMTGAAPGKGWVLDSTLKKAVLIPLPAAAFSEDYLDAGRILAADGATLRDFAGAPIVVFDEDPLTDDLWEGAIVYSKASKGFFGPKGRTAAGIWGDVWKPWETVSGATPTEKFQARWTTIANVPNAASAAAGQIAQLEGIVSSGTWTQNASGLAFPVDGTYRIRGSVAFANNSGSEGVMNAQVLLDGSAPATGPTGYVLWREDNSRFTSQSIDLEWTVTAGQVLALSLWTAAGTISFDGGRGGLLIERIA